MPKFFEKQVGSIMPVTAMALLSIMGMGGLVFDSSHLYINKTKLQNLLDSASLTGSKVLYDTRSQFLARNAANNIITTILQQEDYQFLVGIGLDVNDFSISFSSTRNPFVANPAATAYTRVRLNPNAIDLDTLFLGAFDVDHFDLSGSAIAGPSPSLSMMCNTVPTVVCADPNIAPHPMGMYGYSYGIPVTLSMGNVNNLNTGIGNFQLIDEGFNANDDILRNNIAGASETCLTQNNAIATSPADNLDPVSQGINTRFGIFNGPVAAEDYPPDLVTDAGPPNYPDGYIQYFIDNLIRNYDEPNGIAARRIMPVAFANCAATVNGQGNVDILGFGCLYLNQPAANNFVTNTVDISGELARSCRSAGVPGVNAAGIGGVRTIQLYGDPNRWDS